MGKALRNIGLALLFLVPGLGVVLGPLAATVATIYAVTASLIGSSIERKKARNQPPSRLNFQFDPDTPRKMAFGQTAAPLDIIYQEPSDDNRYHDYIVAVAAHAIESVDELWLNDQLAWTAAGGVQGDYAGYLTVAVRTEGSAANAITINSGAAWSASACRMTGLAYMHLRIRRTGIGKKGESPFVNGLPGRGTVKGKYWKCYDPRQDSTRGGSGSHRADNQATWTWGTHCRNPAIQALNVLLGWRINGIVSVGAGELPANIDFASFAFGANVCDEDIALDAGGTQNRYETHGAFGDDLEPAEVIQEICKHMNAEVLDDRGVYRLRMQVNDLAGPVLELTEADVIGAYRYRAYRPVEDIPTIVRGRYTDPSNTALFQMVPYVEINGGAINGINQPLSFDLPMIQDGIRARRVAQQVYNRQQLGGTFEADFGPRAWSARVGDAVRFTFLPEGLSSAWFRVRSQELKVVVDDDGARTFCPMVLEADDPSVYVKPVSDIAPAPALAIPLYVPTKAPNVPLNGEDIGVDNGATRNVFRGSWASLAVGAAFSIGDEVLDQNALWTPVLPHTKTAGNGPPTLPTTSNATWQLKLESGSGSPGLNVATAAIYAVAVSAPAAPDTDIEFSFATGAFSGLPSPWAADIPAPVSGQKRWRRQAPIAGVNATETIVPGAWGPAVEFPKDGTDGVPGSNNAVIKLYARGASAPAAPTGTFTYTFSSGVLSGGAPGAWTQSDPADEGQPKWVISAVASSPNATDTIAAAEFSAPVIDLGSGTKAVPLFLYRRSDLAPDAPTATLTYTFADNSLSGDLEGSVRSIASTTGSDPVWVRQATATGAAATDTIPPGEWSAWQQVFADGLDGENGISAFAVQLSRPTVTLAADAAGGLIAGELAKAAGQIVARYAGVDVTSSCTFSVVGASSGMAGTVTSGGAYSVTSMGAVESGFITLRATYDPPGAEPAVSVDADFSVAKARRGAAAIRAKDDDLAVPGTTMAAISDVLIMPVANGSVVGISAQCGYLGTGSSGTSNVRLKASWRFVGAPTWTDVSAFVEGIASYWDDIDMAWYGGFCSYSQSLGGFVADGVIEVRLEGQRIGQPISVPSFSGEVVAERTA